MRTNITLVLADQSPELAAAHDELYPERVGEHIPLSLTLLYPWIPDPTDADVEELARFFAGRAPFEFELTRVAEFPGAVVYAVPEPDDELRETMRALWARYPERPPYGKPSSDPAPHATLARLDVPPPRSLDGVRERVAPLLPARFVAGEATLMEEIDQDIWQVRAMLPLGIPDRMSTHTSTYTKISLREVEDSAPKFKMPSEMQARFARRPIGGETLGLSLFTLEPGFRIPFGHKHDTQEEVYVVVRGSARIKVEDEIVELGEWDAIRLPVGTMRNMEAGPDGVEYLAFGAGDDPNEAEMTPGWWEE